MKVINFFYVNFLNNLEFIDSKERNNIVEEIKNL